MRVGLVGTGYAAKLRAEALKADSRVELVAIAGHDPVRTQTFSQTYEAIACPSWQSLIDRADIDLVVISTVNSEHGAIVQAALKADKHVVIEYPLALDVQEAATLVELAQKQKKLLHVEHIELLGGVHQALKASLPQVGQVFYARYITTKPEHPAPERWSYHSQQFGFPLAGALSRLHRLIDVFGEVDTVACQTQYWVKGSSSAVVLPVDYYTSCLCKAHLRFKNGVLAEVTYGKGEALWQAQRKCEVHGEHGALIFDGEAGTLITRDGPQPIQVGGRRGLFAKDTAAVLDFLESGQPLYIQPTKSLYTLKVADAARRSAESGFTIAL